MGFLFFSHSIKRFWIVGDDRVDSEFKHLAPRLRSIDRPRSELCAGSVDLLHALGVQHLPVRRDDISLEFGRGLGEIFFRILAESGDDRFRFELSCRDESAVVERLNVGPIEDLVFLKCVDQKLGELFGIDGVVRMLGFDLGLDVELDLLAAWVLGGECENLSRVGSSCPVLVFAQGTLGSEVCRNRRFSLRSGSGSGSVALR